MVRHCYLNRIKVEIHDITAKPDTNQVLPKFGDNRVPLIFIDNRPVYLAWHAWCARTKDTVWVWKSEIAQICDIITKYRGKTDDPSRINYIDIFSDANMIHQEQADIWRELQQKYGFQYSYGTNQNQHISFYGLNDDFVPEKNVEKDQFGYVDSKYENGEKYVIPISALDGVLSHRKFFIVYPYIHEGTKQLNPKLIPYMDFDDNTWISIIDGFESVRLRNEKCIKEGEKLICGFDHVGFINIVKIK